MCVAGAKLDVKNPVNGWTALHCASRHNNIDVVK